MSSITLGEVSGDSCANCRSPLNIEGEFSEGDEVTCDACGAVSMIAEIEASYEVYMELVEVPSEEDKEE